MTTNSQPSEPPADRLPRRCVDIIVVVVAILLLGIPCVAMLLGAPAFFAPVPDSDQAGRRRLRPRLHAFANEGYPLADTLAELGGRLKVEILGETASDLVILGRDDWLFFAADGAEQITRRYPPWRAIDLDLLNRWFATNRQAVEARGMRYVVLFTPEKASVHPEFLPPAIQPLQAPRHLSDLVAFLREQQPDLQLLDSTDWVIASRGWDDWDGNPTPGEVYQRSDTHWNDIGAWAAAEGLLAHLRQDFPTLPSYGRADLRLQREERSGGDLARFMALHERRSDLLPALRWQNVPGSSPDHHREDLVVNYVQTGSANPDLPRALVFRDSFSQRLIPLLTPFFEEVTWLWSYHILDQQALDVAGESGVEVVIHQISERPLVRRSFHYDIARELRRWGVDPQGGRSE